MGAKCCNHTPEIRATDSQYRRVLWAVLLLNAVMFAIEAVAGLAAGSASLQADAMDFLADAANYGISLFVVGMALKLRAGAALAKGLTVGAFGIWVIGSTIWNMTEGTVPEAVTMGQVGFAALLANAASFALLWAYRDGDSNMRSVWLCSRNDVIGNVAVLLAALGVFGTGTGWPDFLVAAIMGGLALHGSWKVVQPAYFELRLDQSLQIDFMRQRMKSARAGALLLMFVFSAGLVVAADVRLEGQVVCCEDCWNKADRTKTTFGTTEDLAKSAGCIANGDPTLLAVSEGGKTVMYQLEQGRFRLTAPNWLEHVGDNVAMTGAVRQQKGKRFLRVNEMQVLQPSLASEEARKVIGTAPELKLMDLSGVEQTLSSRRGRIVVLNFWGTFCIPCAKEMPDLAAIQSNYAALGVEVVGATADTAEDRAKVLKFVKQYRINFPVWMAATSDDMRRFGLGEALPATVILDRDGKIAWQKRGVTTKSELATQIDALLSKSTAKASASSKKRTEAARVDSKSTNVSRVPS